MSHVDAPALSVQIVSWQSGELLDACLASLLAQTHRDFEVVVVDNASSDGSAERAADWLSRGLRGHLVRADRNLGFCGGQNLAFRHAAAAWILFLNPDCTLPPEFMERACEAMARVDANVGTLAPRSLAPNGAIDSTGLFMDRWRRVFDRGQREAAAGAYLSEEDVFGCSGAVALHRRTMLEDLRTDGDVLDEKLFAYYDDLDLSWRAQLRGWRCRYIPSLVAFHARAGRNTLRVDAGAGGRLADQRLAVRNRIRVLLKLERGRDLLAALPRLLIYELAQLVYLLLRRPRVLRAYREVLVALPEILRERRRIQKGVRSDRLYSTGFFPHWPRNAS